MSVSLNQVLLIGNLGRDPEHRVTTNKKDLTKFTVATSQRWGENEQTEWHQIVCWGKNAIYASKYLVKGSQVYIDGYLQTDSWVDKESGQKRYKTQIVVHRISRIGGKAPQQTEQPDAEEPDEDIPF
jgi:single-strand DNA-binding protein